ncbi:MAG: phosphoribosylamine--glycine ligase, partial [Longimicrobiales bacterium]|nr:phosphoribosylamine--glycine ligase [Longimicrobiales bacterium]
MKILIVGNGGREHALLWKLRRDRPDAEFYVTRPNGGMTAGTNPVDLGPGDVDALSSWADGESIDLTVVGPEVPLAAGIVDRFVERDLPAFGPTAAAARLEASKAFAKDLMAEAGVPTASYRTFRELEPALEHIRSGEGPIVVKASGLAAGKGALVCESRSEAEDAARTILEDRAFGEAGSVLVVEECMTGEELSVFALTDGRRAVPLVPSQDHKQIGEGDEGPNTGGMGAYAPVSLGTPELLERVREEILDPTLEALARQNAPFRGLLYAGLMLTDQGPKVVEFNCRFGDPETQVVLPLLDGSLLEPLTAIAGGGSLDGWEPRFRDGSALVTVLASEGYPGSYEKGFPIRIPDSLESDDTLVFHAGTRI